MIEKPHLSDRKPTFPELWKEATFLIRFSPPMATSVVEKIKKKRSAFADNTLAVIGVSPR